ncbi:MAG TPA: hypothetical protein VKX28_20910 [Xanthobacteraceae bacterium]|nr:hypothetical protein [Xanthobacteraceae bacterium]
MAALARVSIPAVHFAPTGGARAAVIDPDTPDYLRPLDGHGIIETERAQDGRLTMLVHGDQFDGGPRRGFRPAHRGRRSPDSTATRCAASISCWRGAARG